MAGAMMKTRRRVKRTVREMPRRLTIRLSKGSNRNMVEDAGQASALLPTNKARPQMVLSDSTGQGRGTNSIPKFTSLDGRNREPGSRMRAKGGPRGGQPPPQKRRAAGVDGAGSVFSASIRGQTECLGESAARARSGLCYSHAASRSFTSSPVQEHLADKSLLRMCHCQKYQEEFNSVPEKS